MVAERFISAKLKFQGKLATVAIAVSFLVIIVAVAVAAGFRREIRSGVAAIYGDIHIAPQSTFSAEPEPLRADFLPSLEAIPEVSTVKTVVSRGGIVKRGDTVHGVIVKGFSGSSLGPMEVSVPRRLGEITGLDKGDEMVCYFVGEKVKVRKFRIAAVHSDMLETDDNLIVYAPLEDLRRVCGWEEDQVSSVELTLTPAFRGKKMQDAVADKVASALEGRPLIVTTSARSFPGLFDWLDLLDSNVLIILILMTVVAGFNMVSGLLIMILKNIPVIGTLKTLGMDDRAIGRIYLRVSGSAAMKGLVIGNVLAMTFCFIQGTTHLIPLDPDNYFISFVPVSLNVPAILAADIAAYAGILLLTWLPAGIVSRIDPASTVKAD